MKVAVAILNYNGEKLLPRFLPSVLAHSRTPLDQVEVVVIDNASSDGSIGLLRQDFPQVRIIPLTENTGYSGGYNRGLADLDADVAVLLNSDVEVTTGWLDRPLQMLRHDEQVAAVQPKIRSLTDPSRFDYAGAGGGYMDALGYPYCRGRMFDTIEVDNGQYDDETEVMWGSGACLFIRCSDYVSAGGLDERFFAHMEEIELCWKLKRMGRRVMYCGGSTVFHLGGGTLPVGSPRKTYLNFRNNLSLLYRHLPARRLPMVFLLRLLLDLVAALRFRIGGMGPSAAAVCRAHWHFLTSIGREQEARRRWRNWPYPKELPGQGSLLWRYYVRGKKTFGGS